MRSIRCIGKNNDRGAKGFSVFHHHDEILKGSQLDPSHAEAFGSQGENHAPEFVPGIAQRYHYHRSRREGRSSTRLGHGTCIDLVGLF